MNIREILEGLKQYINSRNASVFKPVDTLPTASENTLNFIFLVPNGTENGRDEYITIDNGEEANPRYTWDNIGATTIDLNGYVTEEGLNLLLAQLAEYVARSVNYTTTQAKFINEQGEETGVILDSADSTKAGLLSASTFGEIEDLKTHVATLNTFKAQQEETNEAIQEAIDNIPTDTADCVKREEFNALVDRIHTDVTSDTEKVYIKNKANTDTLAIPSASNAAAGILSSADYEEFKSMASSIAAINNSATAATASAAAAQSAAGQVSKFNNRISRLEKGFINVTVIDDNNSRLASWNEYKLFYCDDTDNLIIFKPSDSGSTIFSVILPEPSENIKGKVYYIKDETTYSTNDRKIITVYDGSKDDIGYDSEGKAHNKKCIVGLNKKVSNAESWYEMEQESLMLICDGTYWLVFGNAAFN